MSVPDFDLRGPCRHDPELFFPAGREDSYLFRARAEQAKAICDSCPVAAECLTWALETGQDAGIWGGTTPSERRALRQGAGAVA